MKFEVLVQNNNNGTAYDITELITDIMWETNIIDSPAKLAFTYILDGNDVMAEGSPISLKIDDNGVFFGYVFKRTQKQDGKIAVTAYDQMRYLKNKDTYVFSGATASKIFAKICSDYKLKHKIVDASSFVCPPKVNDNKSLFEMLQEAIDQTLIHTGKWYIIRDNFGVLEFINLTRLRTDLFIGTESLLTGFDYESSIDDDTYNQIKLIKENKETLKREVFIVKDSANMRKWGTLQYFEKMDESANPAQIQERAEMLLKLKNRATKKLKINCIGDLRVRAGSGVVLGIDELGESIPKNKHFIVTSCSHKFQNDSHTMDLEILLGV